MNRSAQSNLVRAAIALFLLAGLAAVAGNSLFPEIPATKVVLYALAGGAVALAVVVALALASLPFRQFVIRKGGTDAQWFWFSGEPAGLVRVREEAREASHARSGDEPTGSPRL